MVKSENTVERRNKSVKGLIRFIYHFTSKQLLNSKYTFVTFTENSKKFIINDTWTHRLVTAVTQ